MRQRTLLPVQTRAEGKTAEERNIDRLVAQNAALTQEIAVLRQDLLQARVDLAKYRGIAHTTHIRVPLA